MSSGLINLEPVGRSSELPVETVDRCLACDDQRQELLFYGSDDRYGYPGSFPIVKCQSCGLVYLGKRIAPAAVGQLYEKYYISTSAAGGKLAAWKNRLKKIGLLSLCQLIFSSRENPYKLISLKPGLRVLDVGSGVVEDRQQILQQGGEWLGVDVNPKVCQALQNAGLPGFCGTLEQFYETRPEPFDYVILSQVLEHVYRPRQFLRVARSLLRPHGNIILSCPNYDSFLRQRYERRWLHWHVPYHVAHYNRSTLTQLAQAAGLNIVQFQTFTNSTWLYAQEQLAKGVPYSDGFLAKKRWQQRWLDLRLVSQHRLHRGDVIVARLEVNREA